MYRRSLVDQYGELATEGFRIGLPVLDLEDVFVPLRVVTGIPEKIPGAIVSTKGKISRQSIWEFLTQLPKIKAYRRLALIAPPGSGKTTLLKHVTLIYARTVHSKYGAPKFVPVLLYLRDVRHLLVGPTPPTLADLITQQILGLPALRQLQPLGNWVETLLSSGRCLVMLDGLDEVADIAQRTVVSQWVNQQMLNYPRTAFILTSRPAGYRSAPVEQVGTVLEVLPFSAEQTRQFIRSWYQQIEIRVRAGKDNPAVRAHAMQSAEDLITRIQGTRAIAEMARNPLLVMMIATVHYCGSALPGRRVELYQRICDLLLGPRQEAKKIEVPLTGEQNKSVLRVLALGLMKRQTREFTPALGRDLVQSELKQVADELLSPEQFLKQIKEVSGLLVEREVGVYEFAHLSFQEYLAAAQVKELQQEQILTDNFSEPWWAETIRLYAAQGDATDLIRTALAKPTVASLTLALDCREESLRVDPAVRREFDGLLDTGLGAKDHEMAQLAAEVKLNRRLLNLLKLNETVAIDRSYITWAEYRLFLEEHLKVTQSIPAGQAAQPVTGVSLQNAIQFCAWLSLRALARAEAEENELLETFRLPTSREVHRYPVSDTSFEGCWTLSQVVRTDLSLRIVKALIPDYGWMTDPQEEHLFFCTIAQRAINSDVEGLLQSFDFETVTVNRKGEEIERNRCQAKRLEENLSSGTKLEMVEIPEGSLEMGSPQTEEDRTEAEGPQHWVKIAGFLMGKYPVTQAQWRVVSALPKIQHDLNPTPSHFKGDNRPVEQVSWLEAVEFCDRLSHHTGREYRLPTEAEWEYVCRAGTTTPFHCGETITTDLANYRGTDDEFLEWSGSYGSGPKGRFQKRTTPVGDFPANAFDLNDMHGNVWEWCLDDWHGSYEGAPTDGSAWVNTENDNHYHVLRGGSWGATPGYCRSASRYVCRAGDRYDVIGFRLVCSAART